MALVAAKLSHSKEYCMKKASAFLPLVTVLAMSTYAYAADESDKSSTETKKNGGYESTTTSQGTTDAGTYNSTKTTDNVDVDSKGNVTRKYKTKSVEDPKGLMNKKTSTGEITYQDKDNGGYKKTVDEKSTNAAGTNYSHSSKTNVDVDAQGNVTTTKKTENTVDPKGFTNPSTTTTTSSKTVNGEVVEENKQVK